MAATLVDKAIAGCGADDVEEICSLGKTLSSWRNEIVAHHRTGASNGPTAGLIPGSRRGEDAEDVDLLSHDEGWRMNEPPLDPAELPG